MTYSDHIGDLITAAKSRGNSEHKNRGLSHLKDAYAHFKLEELELLQRDQAYVPEDSNPIMKCICPDGAVDRQCPIHGYNVK